MPETQETALAVQSQKSSEIIKSARMTRLAAFTPSNLTEAIALAKMMAASGMVPTNYQKKPADILVAIQFGSEIGLAPMQSLQSITVINGRPSLWGDGALALVQGHPDFEDIIETTEGTTAVCVVKRKGRTPCRRTFSDEDAAKAGLLSKGPWTQYRARMRQMRSRGFALRDSFADVLRGISIAEEAMDIPVDTSQAKQQRDAMTFDVSALAPSTQENRGHDDTGLDKKPNGAKPDQQAPAEKPAMCGFCGQTGSHAADCKFAEQAAKTAQFAKNAYFLTAVQKKTSKKQGEYLLLTVESNSGSGFIYCWHGHLHQFFLNPEFVGKKVGLVAEVSQNEKDGKQFYSVEHVQELDGVTYVNDKPVEEAEIEEGSGLFAEE